MKGENMTLAEKLYMLRKKAGLSQEQLADQLNVSRQAISKWESGKSVPESDKLVSVSNYFSVSLDYLLKEDHELGPTAQSIPQKKKTGKASHLIGLLCCIVGAVCLIIKVVLSLLDPGVSDGLSESSVIRIDGNGIIFILCVAVVVLGVLLLLKDRNQRN